MKSLSLNKKPAYLRALETEVLRLRHEHFEKKYVIAQKPDLSVTFSAPKKRDDSTREPSAHMTMHNLAQPVDWKYKTAHQSSSLEKLNESIDRMTKADKNKAQLKHRQSWHPEGSRAGASQCFKFEPESIMAKYPSISEIERDSVAATSGAEHSMRRQLGREYDAFGYKTSMPSPPKKAAEPLRTRSLAVRSKPSVETDPVESFVEYIDPKSDYARQFHAETKRNDADTWTSTHRALKPAGPLVQGLPIMPPFRHDTPIWATAAKRSSTAPSTTSTATTPPLPATHPRRVLRRFEKAPQRPSAPPSEGTKQCVRQLEELGYRVGSARLREVVESVGGDLGRAIDALEEDRGAWGEFGVRAGRDDDSEEDMPRRVRVPGSWV